MYYEVTYGDQRDEWQETAYDLVYKSFKSFMFDYDISQRSQQIDVKITVDFTPESEQFGEKSFYTDLY